MLEVRDVTKSYGDVQALDSVDLEIRPGEICGLLGRNGAGKTTLASLVAGLIKPDRGEILVAGIDVARDPSKARQCLGLAPQELGLYPTLSVRDNLMFFGEMSGVQGRDLTRRLAALVDALQLSPVLDRPVRHCSGGQKRRVHTAVAMLHEPAVLVLDEPTSAADVTARNELLRLVEDQAARGASVCYSTHYMAEVEAMDATVAIIDDGRVIARGTVGELVNKYGQPALELRFTDGPAPELRGGPWHSEVTGSLLRVFTAEPARSTPAILDDLADDLRRVQAIEVVNASLEAVFLELTGRRFASGEA